MSNVSDFFLEDICFNGDIVPAQNGDIQIIRGIQNLKQALFNRLITVKGSLAHRPNYGIGVQSYRNKISSIGTQRELALEIKNQFEQEERIDKLVSVSFKAEPSGIFIVNYRVLAKGFGEIGESINPFGE
jgi:phage baseplate assembly protein W